MIPSSLVDRHAARNYAKHLFLQHYPDQNSWFDVMWDALDSNSCPDQASHITMPVLGLPASSSLTQTEAHMLELLTMFVEVFLISVPVAPHLLMKRLHEVCAQRGKTEDYAQRLINQLGEQLHAKFPAVSRSEAHSSPSISALSPITGEHVPTDAARPNIVWTSAAYGNGASGYPCTKQEADTLHARMNREFNIFIDGPVVYLRNGDNAARLEEVECRRELYIMLVVLLRYKPRPVPSKELYLRVTRQKETRMDPGYMKQDSLRFIKREIKQLLSAVPGVHLPRKTSDKGYRCSGDFPYCVIVSRLAAPEFYADLRVNEFEQDASVSV